MTLLYLLVVNVPQRFHQDHSFTLWRPGSDLTSLQTTWAARRESQELHSTLDKKQQQTVQQSCPPEAWQIRGGNKKSYWRIHGKGWSDKVRARCKIFFRFFVQIQFYLLQKNVTKIKCTKWLSIDLAVHKERKKEMSSVFLHCYNSESKSCNLGFKLVSNQLPQVSPHHHSISSGLQNTKPITQVFTSHFEKLQRNTAKYQVTAKEWSCRMLSQLHWR